MRARLLERSLVMEPSRAMVLEVSLAVRLALSSAPSLAPALATAQVVRTRVFESCSGFARSSARARRTFHLPFASNPGRALQELYRPLQFAPGAGCPTRSA